MPQKYVYTLQLQNLQKMILWQRKKYLSERWLSKHYLSQWFETFYMFSDGYLNYGMEDKQPLKIALMKTKS